MTMTVDELLATKEMQKELAHRRSNNVEPALRTLDQVGRSIEPLKFEPPRQGEERQLKSYVYRNIITADGEVVGHVRVMNLYGFRSDLRFRLSSSRIPNRRSRWSMDDWGYRDYKKVDSLTAAIRKFCIPVSKDEQKAQKLRDEIAHYNRKIYLSRNRAESGKVNDRYISWTYKTSALVRELAEGGEREAAARKVLEQFVRRQRVHNRFAAWVTRKFIEPRQAELEKLDLSKEKID